MPPPNKNELAAKQQNSNQQELHELQELWKELAISSSSLQQDDRSLSRNRQSADVSSIPMSTSVWQPIICLGFGTAVLLNIGILCSLPPVIRGRGTIVRPWQIALTKLNVEKLTNLSRLYSFLCVLIPYSNDALLHIIQIKN